MNAQDFVSKSDYSKMFEAIHNQQPFEFEKEHKKFRIEFYSSNAKWSSKTVNEGDYFVGCNTSKLFGDYLGGGRPLEKAQYEKIFSSYESLAEYVDKSLRDHGCPLSVPQPPKTVWEQMSLF